jgi:hypothetical protein
MVFERERSGEQTPSAEPGPRRGRTGGR